MGEDSRGSLAMSAETPVEHEERTDGVVLMRALEPLGDYPSRFTDRLVEFAASVPDRTLVARRGPDGDWRRVGYAEMLERVRRVAQSLLERDLGPERPLMVLSGNDIDHLLIGLAAMHVGIPYAPVSPAYSLVSRDFGKLRGIVSLLTPGLVFASEAGAYGDAIRACGLDDAELVLGSGTLDGVPSTPFATLLDSRAGPGVAAAHAAVDGDTIAKFLFTSGSTKAPKAVITTHRMLCSNQQVIRQALRCLADEPPVLVDWLPWNHVFGGNHNLGIVISNGGTLYIDDGKPVAGLVEHTLANLREISPTVYFNVPRGFEEIVLAMDHDAALRRRFFSRVQMLFTAGAGMPDAVVKGLARHAHAELGRAVGLYSGLGMTETAPFAIGPAPLGNITGAIGGPAPGVTLKLVPNDGKLELRYAGPGVTPGYWRSPELGAEAFDDEGFFRSGDAVRFVDRQRPATGLVFDGRIAEDFKLATGTWVSVGPLRTRSLSIGSPCVADVVITGQDRDEVGMLVFPRMDACARLAGAAAGADPATILAAAPVREFFQRFVDRLHADGTGTSNRVGRILLMLDPPAIDRGEMTDKGSLNQRAVLACRAGLVEELHAGSPAVILARPAPARA